VNIAALPDTSRIGPHVRLGRIDAELAALVGLLAANGISLVVAAPPDGRPVAGDLLAALDPVRRPVDLDALGDGNRALLRAASLGAGFAATIEASSLDDVFGRLRAMAGLSDDELSYLGVVLVLDPDGNVEIAHHVRPIALDAHGHVQRLAPAVLAARDRTSGRLEHFAWGVLPELASRIRWKAGDLEAEVDRHRDALAHAAGHPS
jgi:hypothetical protein